VISFLDWKMMAWIFWIQCLCMTQLNVSQPSRLASILTLGVAAPDLHAGVLMAMKFYIEG
jgi:hypothetical protein